MKTQGYEISRHTNTEQNTPDSNNQSTTNLQTNEHRPEIFSRPQSKLTMNQNPSYTFGFNKHKTFIHSSKWTSIDTSKI